MAARRIFDYTPDNGYNGFCPPEVDVYQRRANYCVSTDEKAIIKFWLKRRDSFKTFNVLDYALSTDEDRQTDKDASPSALQCYARLSTMPLFLKSCSAKRLWPVNLSSSEKTEGPVPGPSASRH